MLIVVCSNASVIDRPNPAIVNACADSHANSKHLRLRAIAHASGSVELDVGTAILGSWVGWSAFISCVGKASPGDRREVVLVLKVGPVEYGGRLVRLREELMDDLGDSSPARSDLHALRLPCSVETLLVRDHVVGVDRPRVVDLAECLGNELHLHVRLAELDIHARLKIGQPRDCIACRGTVAIRSLKEILEGYDVRLGRRDPEHKRPGHHAVARRGVKGCCAALDVNDLCLPVELR
mmetsp:Transcript_15674/g.31666  ORF Transcript_15674/g.31666 Transcript_15674/m.31666 type:complete len:237 (+) Transcript_15674:2979-3689(+)